MHLDVADLKQFYETPLGAVTRRMLRRQIRSLWPDVSHSKVLGLGYATPYLRPFLNEAERVLGFMPGGQGVIAWPHEGPGLTTLTDERELPLPDAAIDRILIIHALETSDAAESMLREVWRILAPGGRLLIVVPSRRGFWAQSETTPFGHGRPFSRSQLSRLLRDHLFTPTQWGAGLHFWPVRGKMLLRWAGAFETIGARWLPALAGVHLVEASKQIYAVPYDRTLKRVRRAAPILVLPTPHPVPRNTLYWAA